MIRKKDDILGGYIPAFFEMQVNCSTNNFDFNRLSNNELSVFLHEYVPFLQDITTTYGLSNIYFYSEYLSSVINRLYKCPKPSDFDVPFLINDNNDNVLLNQQIRSVTIGDSAFAPDIQISYISDVLINDFNLLPNPNLLDIKEITLCLKTESGSDELYTFGALAIMENMAYLIERLCFPNDYTKSPDYPYTTAEKVSDYYVNEFSKNSEMVLALCDMSLMTFNPGQVYVEVMQDIKNGHLNFSKPEDIYDYFYSLSSESVYTQRLLFTEVFDSILSIAKSKIKNYIRDMPIITNDFYTWIDKIYSFAKECRLQKRYIFLEIARAGALKNNTIFNSIMNRIGSPLMTCDNKHFYKIPYEKNTIKTDVEYFKAIGQITKLFESGEKACSLLEWCKNSPLNQTNSFCVISPWKKCFENNLCFYAMLWKHWNLVGYTPK